MLAYKVNAGQDGILPGQVLGQGRSCGTGQEGPAKDPRSGSRWGLQNDLFALARSGEIGIDAYAAHLRAYRDEADTLPAASIAGHLMQAWLLLDGPARERVAAAGSGLLARMLGRIGVEPAAGEPVPTSLLRGRILLPAALFGVVAARELGAGPFDRIERPGAVPADIRQATMQIAAWTRGHQALDRLLRLCRGSDSEQERLNALQALGWLWSKLLEEALALALAEVPSRNTYIPIAAAAGNPLSYGWMWGWWMAHLGQMKRLHRMHQERIIAAVVPVADAADVAARLRDYVRERPALAEAAALSLELREINQRMRARAARDAG